jgi:CRISPR-associated endoribonuclease Cas6
MRLHFKLQPSKISIPFDHQSLLVGVIHKWLGWNEEHGRISMYSFSRLEGGKATNKGLSFENGATFFFSSYNTDLLKKIICGIRADSSMFCGLQVSDITIQEDLDLSQRELFFTASPILIKRYTKDKSEHILYDDPRANSCLKETLETKLKEVGLSDDSLDISFQSNYPKAGTKMITYKGIDNKANWCPLRIKGKPETKIFAWNVGLGNSTGIGFGAIK